MLVHWVHWHFDIALILGDSKPCSVNAVFIHPICKFYVYYILNPLWMSLFSEKKECKWKTNLMKAVPIMKIPSNFGNFKITSKSNLLILNVFILTKIYNVTLLATPLPPLVTNCHNFTNPLPPSMRDIIYERPLWWFTRTYIKSLLIIFFFLCIKNLLKLS